MKKLYVGGLSYSTTEEGLRAFFADFGTIVSVRIMSDKFTNQSRGFGFVEIEEDDRAEDAIAQLNGATLDGKQIKVNEARPQESRTGGGGSRGGFGGGRGGSGGGGGNRRNFRNDRRSDFGGGRSSERRGNSW